MAFLGQEEQVRELQDRFRLLYITFFIAIVILISRLVYLQVLSGDRMRQFSEENRIKRVKISSPRGMIFDRNGTLLIDNRPSFDLEITPQYLVGSGQKDEVIERLSKLINLKPAEINEILEKGRGPKFLPIKIKTDLDRDEVAQIETFRLDMPGVQVTEEIKRTHIYGDNAAHLFGYISEINSTELPKLNKKGLNYKLGDVIGKSGLEQQHEKILRGQDGVKLVEVDALGRTKLDSLGNRVLARTTSKEIPAIPGKNLTLTIDQDLQMVAQEALGTKSGSVVAINPKTGEVLAMVSRPSYNPTQFSRGIPTSIWNELINNEDRPLRDKTIQDHYMPGSVFKVVTAIAGLEEGAIDENTRFHCSGSMRIGNRVYHCHKKGGHGDIGVIDALTQSCDVFFYRVSQKLGSVDKIAEWAFHLGLGKKTGIKLAREVSGLVPTEEWKMKRLGQVWNAGETLSVAIGQSFVLTTTLQLANLYASIANGGTLYRPYVVSRVENEAGGLVEKFEPEIISNFRLKPKTAELIKKGLWGVINSPRGTAHSQRIPGVEYMGKTGTAQVVRLSADKIYQKCENMKYRFRHNGLFAGFAPAEDPTIAVAVIGEHVCHGSSGAGPIGRAVIKKYLEKTQPELFTGKIPLTVMPNSTPRPEEEEDIVPLGETEFVLPEAESGE